MDRIVTKRLVLRSLELKDAEAMFDYAKLDEVGPKAGWTPHKTVEESHHVIQFMMHSNEVWAITLKDDHTLIGTIGLHAESDFGANTKSLGYVLHPKYHNQGLMTEAALAVILYGFEQMDLECIRCGHFVDNIASKRVIEKCGFMYQNEAIKEFKLFGIAVNMRVSEYEIHRTMYKENQLPWQQH